MKLLVSSKIGFKTHYLNTEEFEEFAITEEDIEKSDFEEIHEYLKEISQRAKLNDDIVTYQVKVSRYSGAQDNKPDFEFIITDKKHF